MDNDSDMTINNGDRPSTKKQPSPPTHELKYARTRDENTSSVLSAEEIAAIREQARLKVRNEMKDREHAVLLDKYVEEERQALIPEEEMCEIFLNLAPHSTYIMLDGKQYHHDNWYRVKRSVYSVLVEQINRGWAHDEQTQVTDAKGRRRWRPPPGIGFTNFATRVGPWGEDRNLVMGSPEAAALVQRGI
jgi:hypothetical protein